jgi:hypothetical protein
MNSIDAAIEAIELREASASFSYGNIVNWFGVDCTMLS